MKLKLKLTRVGMSMEEGTITKWHITPGENFKLGDILYEFETEKVANEVEAEGNGKLVEICAKEGETIKVGEAVCIVESFNV